MAGGWQRHRSFEGFRPLHLDFGGTVAPARFCGTFRYRIRSLPSASGTLFAIFIVTLHTMQVRRPIRGLLSSFALLIWLAFSPTGHTLRVDGIDAGATSLPPINSMPRYRGA